MFKLLALVAWLFVVGVDDGLAANYYVAPSGQDSNPGTLSLPWRTIQKAANVLAPGDTAYVRAGTYGLVTVNVSGSKAGGLVTFANYPGEAPVIDATGVTAPADDTALFLLADRSYVVIEGFELRNYQTANVALTPAGILLTGACQHVQIRRCSIHDIRNTGGDPANSGNAFGIAVYGSSTTPATDVVIDGNEIFDLKTGSSESMALNGNVTNFQVTNNRVHDNNNIGIDFIGFEGTCPDPSQDQARDGECSGNAVWNISSQGNQAYPDGDYSADGLYCDGATGVVLERNVVYDDDIGVELASEHAGKLTSGIKLRDNFFYGNRQAGLLVGGYAASGTGGTQGCTITGNTFFNDDTLQFGNGEAQVRFRTSNCVFKDNLFYTGAGDLLVTVPVTAANNVNNVFDYNLYYCADGNAAAMWSWNNAPATGLDAWRKASGQDAHALFVNPQLTNTGTSPNLHLQPSSPAVNAGDPAFVAASGELDIDGQPRVIGGRVDIGADEVSTAAPVITSAKNASGAVGAAFSYQITATGSPTSFGVQGLPGGLTINASTGLISGAPRTAGTYTLTLNAYNSAGKGSAALTLTIRPAGTPVITSAATGSSKVGTAFSYEITATGSPTRYGVQGLPGGLSVNGSTGLISGTPKTAGTYTLTINAYNSVGKGSASLTLTIQPAGTPVITSATKASGKTGTAFSYQITATGSPTSYGVQGLPAGLSVNASTGLITGTPKNAGTYTLTLNAYNPAGKGTVTLTLTVTD